MHDFSKCSADDPSCPEISLSHKTVTPGLPVMNRDMDRQSDRHTHRQTDRQTKTKHMIVMINLE